MPKQRAYIILPKTRPRFTSYHGVPLLYFAGPILGGGDWQAKMFRMCMETGNDFLAAIPAQWTDTHPLWPYHLPALSEFTFQLPWERWLMREAMLKRKRGCLMFWLAEQKEPREDGGDYAMDTRAELGASWQELTHTKHARVVVGAEEGFKGLSTIKRNFELSKRNFTIEKTMERVVKRAFELARPLR